MIASLLKYGQAVLEGGHKRKMVEISAWLAGRTAGDMGKEDLDGNMQDEVQAALYAAMTNAELEPRWRADAGDVLWEMGWQPDDLYTFVEIPYPVRRKGHPDVFWIGKSR